MASFGKKISIMCELAGDILTEHVQYDVVVTSIHERAELPGYEICSLYNNALIFVYYITGSTDLQMQLGHYKKQRCLFVSMRCSINISSYLKSTEDERHPL